MKYVCIAAAGPFQDCSAMTTVNDLAGRGILGLICRRDGMAGLSRRFAGTFSVKMDAPDSSVRDELQAVLNTLGSADSAELSLTAGERTADGLEEEVTERVVATLAETLEDAGEDWRLLLAAQPAGDGPAPFLLYDSRFDLRTGAKFCRNDAETGPSGDLGYLVEVLFK